MFSLMVMSRANEESETKSKRVKEAWDNKKKMIHEKKINEVVTNVVRPF